LFEILEHLELVMFGILEWLPVGGNLISDKFILIIVSWYWDRDRDRTIEVRRYSFCLMCAMMNPEFDILIIWWFWFTRICKGILSKWMQTIFHQFQCFILSCIFNFIFLHFFRMIQIVFWSYFFTFGLIFCAQGQETASLVWLTNNYIPFTLQVSVF